MDSDSVNSIDDTEESLMVAEIIKESFYMLMTKRDWPFLRTLTNLDGLSDTDFPTKMQIPETLNKVFWIKYNNQDVCYIEPKKFHDMISLREEQADVIDANGYGISSDPIYWTTYDDKYIFFDSRDQDADSTLQTSKAAVYGVAVPSWTHEDEFIPDIPEKFFPTLLAEAKSTCFASLKQQPNAKEEAKSRRGLIQMQKEAWVSNDGEHKTNTAVDYGRR
jgi:hypothetical protein